jgi:phage terminase Nu1 subunit (DNA packaging protein)
MQSVTRWERDGMPIAQRGARGRPSRYDLAVVEAWRAAKEAAARTPGAAVSLELERARKERAQAALTEQTHQSRARELLPRDEVKRVMEQRAAAIRAKLLAWPTTLADRVHRAGTLDGLAGVECVLAEAVREALLELAGQAL